MLCSALLTGTLAAKLKAHAQLSARDAYRTKILFDTNQRLQDVYKRQHYTLTVRENLCMGESFSDDALRQALERVGLAQKVASMPRGLDTRLESCPSRTWISPAASGSGCCLLYTSRCV